MARWYTGKNQNWQDKFNPQDTAKQIQEMTVKEIANMKKRMGVQQRDAQAELVRLINERGKSDKERFKYLESLKKVKKDLLDNQMKEDMRHNYLYHILMDNYQVKDNATKTGLEEMECCGKTPPLDSLGTGVCCG